jgi:hypothetical protein
MFLTRGSFGSRIYGARQANDQTQKHNPASRSMGGVVQNRRVERLDNGPVHFRGSKQAIRAPPRATGARAAKVQAGGQEAAKAKFGPPVIVNPLDWG